MTILDEFERLPRWGEPDPGHLRERFLEAHRETLRRALKRDAAIENPGAHLSVINAIADAVQDGIVADYSYIGIAEEHVLPVLREVTR